MFLPALPKEEGKQEQQKEMWQSKYSYTKILRETWIPQMGGPMSNVPGKHHLGDDSEP